MFFNEIDPYCLKWLPRFRADGVAMGMSMRTIQNLNDLAAPFLHGNRFVQDKRGRLFIELRNPEAKRWTKRNKISADLRKDRRWFHHRAPSRFVGFGGTGEMTLCQLILWWRREPRLPGRVLRNWWADRPEMHGWRKLVEEVYDDDQSITCVLCGGPFEGLDWWSLGKVTGPCCSFGRCQEGMRCSSTKSTPTA